MQQNIKKLAFVLAIALMAFSTPKQSYAQENNVSFQVFYDALSPYGQWVDYQSYGYVWIPDVGSDFIPYSTSGYWTLTDYGWTWVSDYDWGWAPFHYGRWNFDNNYGWLWVPGNEWGPSWVNWRRADGYYGWSPMEPGSSITLSIGMPYDRYNDHWMFVRDMDFERHDIHRYSVNQSEHANLFRGSAVINTTYIDNSRHTTYVSGPSRTDVQKVTGHMIRPVAIQENNRPGRDTNDGKLRMYRPQMTKNGALDHKPAPNKVENIKDVKRPSERTVNSQPRNSIPPVNNIKQTPSPAKTIPAGRPAQQPQQGAKPQNSIAQPQPQRAVPAGNSERQQQHATPAANGQKQPQQNVRPQNSNPQPQHQPQEHAAPAANSQKQPQQSVKPQNSNPQPQQQPQQHAAPAGNNERQPQQNARPQNSNPQQQQQPQQHAAPAVKSPKPPQNTPKPQIQEQEKEKRDGDAKKQSN